MTNLTHPRVHRFIEEMASPRCLGQTDAARNAGFTLTYAPVMASRLMADPQVVEAIAARRASLARLADIDAAAILQRWLDIATADPSKLVKHRRLNCRHCWGVGYAYQWTAWEYADAAARVMDWKWSKQQPERPPLPDASGGLNFVFNLDPNPECPRCCGEGVPDMFIADTSTLTGPERVLFAGLKPTAAGVQVLMHDQMAALDNLRDYLGMIVKRQELTGKDGRPLFPQGALPMVEEVPTDPKLLEIAYRDITSL